MKNLSPLLLIVLIFLSGCSWLKHTPFHSSRQETPAPKLLNASQQAMKDYLYVLNRYDGIQKEEALILAQSEIIFRGYENDYDLDEKGIREEQQHWEIKANPRYKTLEETSSKPQLSILIKKEGGHVDVLREERIDF